MVKRIRLSVRNVATERIIGFIYYDHATAGDDDTAITAVDDGRELITGLAIPFDERELCHYFECDCLQIDVSRPKVFDF